MNKQYVIAGVIGIGAIVLFYHFAKTPAAVQQTQPSKAAPLSASQYPPPGVATYPGGANIAPAPINIQEAPLIFNYNYPSTRTPDLTAGKKKDGCGCCPDDRKALSPSIFAASSKNLQSVGSKFARRQQRAT